MNFAIEHLAYLCKLKMYCRIAGTNPKEGTVLIPYGNPEDYAYKINNTQFIFSAEAVQKIVLDKYGAEIHLG